MTNRELAETFTLIANLLEIKGETVYKTLAYRRAAESLTALAGDVNQYWKEEKLLEIPGVGKSIAEKIDELMTYRQPSVPPEDRAGGAGGTGGVAPGAGAGSQEGGADLEGAGDHDPGGADRRRAGGQAADAHGSGGEVRGADPQRDRVAGAPVGTRSPGPGVAAGPADHRRAAESERGNGC